MRAAVEVCAWVPRFSCGSDARSARRSSPSARPTTAGRSIAAVAARALRDGKRKRVISKAAGGRFDHAARNADYRARRHASRMPTKIVTDTGSMKLAADAMSSLRDDASASVAEEHAAVVKGTDDGTDHRDDSASAARDAASRDGREARGDEGNPGPDDSEPPASGGDPARGTRPLAPAGAVCCVVCGRRGVFVRDPDDRRARLRAKDRSLRRRGRVPRPPAARSPDPWSRELR